MENPGLDESQAGIKIDWRNIKNTSQICRWYHSTGRKSLDDSERGEWKLNIKKTKMMAPGPITLWQIDGEKVEAVIDFIFLGSKITANDECSHEIKRHLLLWRKAMINLDSVLKSRDITLPAQVWIVETIVLPIVMYKCENWVIKKAECWKIDAFELWCWRRLLRVPWTERRSNQ